jgi:hypothetical protein
MTHILRQMGENEAQQEHVNSFTQSFVAIGIILWNMTPCNAICLPTFTRKALPSSPEQKSKLNVVKSGTAMGRDWCRVPTNMFKKLGQEPRP